MASRSEDSKARKRSGESIDVLLEYVEVPDAAERISRAYALILQAALRSDECQTEATR